MTCKGTTVTLSLGSAADLVSVPLAYTAATDRLALSPAATRDLEARWAQPAAALGRRRDDWIYLYGLVASFDKQPWISATLLAAREALASGDWGSTDKYLADARRARRARDARMAARQRELAAALQSERSKRASLALGEWRHIGRVLAGPVSPPDSEASWFWKQGALCVQQDGATRGTRDPFMRCYDPAAKRWNAREALDRGPLARAPKTSFEFGPNVCNMENGWMVEGMKLNGAGICNYDFFDDDLFVSAEGPVALARGAKGLAVFRPGKTTGEAQISPANLATVQRMLAASAGSRLAGDGDFTFDAGDCTLYETRDGRKSWHPLAHNGKGEAWRPICPPLVAPDQRSMAVAAWRGGKPAEGPEGGPDDIIDLWWVPIRKP